MAIHDLFKISNFKIQLKNQKSIELFVQEANIPGINIGILEMNYESMKDKRPGDSIEFNNLTLTIVIDEDLKAFKEIYNNCIMAHNPLTNTLEIFNEIFDAYLFLTTNRNNIQHKIHFYDAWIQNFSDITLQSTSTEDEQVQMTLEIVYNYYILE